MLKKIEDGIKSKIESELENNQPIKEKIQSLKSILPIDSKTFMNLMVNSFMNVAKPLVESQKISDILDKTSQSKKKSNLMDSDETDDQDTTSKGFFFLLDILCF